MREKLWGYGKCLPADRNDKIRVKVFARAWNARHRQKGQHIGFLTRTCLEVLDVLLFQYHNSASGKCFPSYEAIAAKAGCARSTVHLALRALEQAGVLTWCHRLVRVGARVLRTSNGYRFLAPSENPAGTGIQEIQEKKAVLRPNIGGSRQCLGPVAPVRTVAEQIAALMAG